MKDNKVYVLQKDLPDCKAGNNFISQNDGKYYYTSNNNKTISVYADIVENNPEWFLLKEDKLKEEEITVKYAGFEGNNIFYEVSIPKHYEPTVPKITYAIESVVNDDTVVEDKRDRTITWFAEHFYWKDGERFFEFKTNSQQIHLALNHNFINKIYKGDLTHLNLNTNDNAFWTDEFVREFLVDWEAYPSTNVSKGIKKCIQDFKKSKQSAPVDNKQEMSSIDVFRKYNEQLVEIEKSKIQGEKDWEILSFSYNDGKYILSKDKLTEYFGDPNLCVEEKTLLKIPVHKIHSVLRKSDDEVFSIGDKIEYGDLSASRQSEAVIYEGIINKFCIEIDGSLCAYGEPLQFVMPIQVLTKKKVEPKPILFTTEDEVNIYDAQPFYAVRSIWDIKELSVSKDFFESIDEQSKYLKYFYTKKKAEEYVIQNKPCLSLNDLLSVWDSIWSDFNDPYKIKSTPMYKRFEQLVKDKISKQ